ncbi:autophagy protein Apg5 [Dictyocaulus viviparus]|uniref:Autophagy protein 5 n=1 Tax=Dictyocaulus viviparus TaxID=29172 RepID=A0A0D8Y873_DICVI|nr:autophagy protein Apg5 [Dictyocaulus viviparus]
MMVEFDYEVSRKLWEAAVPVEICLERENDSGIVCPPSYAMLPRCSYLPLYLPRILEQIGAREHGVKLEVEKVWLESNGIPLKIYYPIGVLFDLHKSVDSPTLTITIKIGCGPEEASYVSRDTMESMFMQSIKEANYLKYRRNEIISTMKVDEHKQLWSSLVHDRFDDFWSVNKRLMESTDERPFCDVPIRLYMIGKPFRQVLQPPFDENGESRTLYDALSSFSPGLNMNEKYRFISHGVNLPMETPLTYLGKNLAYPDNFVHICAIGNT